MQASPSESVIIRPSSYTATCPEGVERTGSLGRVWVSASCLIQQTRSISLPLFCFLAVSPPSVFPSHCSVPFLPSRPLVSGSILSEGDQTSPMAADFPEVNALRDETWHLLLPCVSNSNAKFSRVNTSSPALEASMTKHVLFQGQSTLLETSLADDFKKRMQDNHRNCTITG